MSPQPVDWHRLLNCGVDGGGAGMLFTDENLRLTYGGRVPFLAPGESGPPRQPPRALTPVHGTPTFTSPDPRQR